MSNGDLIEFRSLLAPSGPSDLERIVSEAIEEALALVAGEAEVPFTVETEGSEVQS